MFSVFWREVGLLCYLVREMRFFQRGLLLDGEYALTIRNWKFGHKRTTSIFCSWIRCWTALLVRFGITFLIAIRATIRSPYLQKNKIRTHSFFPYGTFSFKWIAVGLCNAPVTFEHCIMSIFSDMLEDTIKVFMDDFSVVSNLFDDCSYHLVKILK